MTHVVKKSPVRRAAAIAFVAACAAGSGASAQTMTANSAEFNGGWRRIQGTENHPIDVSTRDGNGNRVIVDGVILDGGSDTFTQTDNSGAGGVFSGAGGRSRWSSATAIGNNLQVITQGNYNTVIVNSTQTNNGDVTANNNDLNGELDLDD